MKRNLFATLLILSFTNFLFAQQVRRCGTSEYMNRLKAQDPTMEARLQQNEQQVEHFLTEHPDLRTSNSVITVPVVFHILYYNATQNVSDNRIFDQIVTMNNDYARLNSDTANTPAAFKAIASNTTIQFCLAKRDSNGNSTTGIIRKAVTTNGFDPISDDNIKYSATGGDNAWPTTKYLNVWVANFNGSSYGLLGISQFPKSGSIYTDGCCVLYSSVGGNTYKGTFANYNTGRTLTHEAGHWFNLYHVWGDDGGTCTGTDHVTDTPDQTDATYGCPSFPLTDACSPAAPGVMFMNYMDYANDNCMNMFSTGQTNRMVASINAFRASILTSDGCQDVNGISEYASGFPVSIFPNPAHGSVTISGHLNKAANLVVTITNMLGEVVYSTEIKNALQVNLPVDLSGYAQGIYNVSLKTTDAVVYRKITVVN